MGHNSRGQVLLTCDQSIIITLSFWPRPVNGHDMALELVFGADLRCLLHHVSSLTRWNGHGAKFGRKMTDKIQNLNLNCCFLAWLLLTHMVLETSKGPVRTHGPEPGKALI